MRPIPLLAAANGVGDPAAHLRGGAPNAGARGRERGELPPPTFPRGPQGPRGFVLYGVHANVILPPALARTVCLTPFSLCRHSTQRTQIKRKSTRKAAVGGARHRRIRPGSKFRPSMAPQRRGHFPPGIRNSATRFSAARRFPAITPPRASRSVMAERCPIRRAR